MSSRQVSSRNSSSYAARPHNININVRLLAVGIAAGAIALFATPTTAASLERCAPRFQQWRYLSAVRGRQLCANILRPEIVQVNDESWFVAVHVDRAPTVALTTRPRAGNLRGDRDRRPRQQVATHRELPHQYFVKVVEATMNAISSVEPGASVDVVVFSEGRWGEMVDEQGVPIDWDIGSEICEELGLQCSQELVLLNSHRRTNELPRSVVPEALECIGGADVFISSEDEFSRAAAALSHNVKVLTDQWEEDADEDEQMTPLDVATTIAGMKNAELDQLKRVVGEWRECSLQAKYTRFRA